jgi:hypothetical protein
MKCDHCGVKRFVCLMYNCTDLNICACYSSDKLSSPNSKVSISKHKNMTIGECTKSIKKQNQYFFGGEGVGGCYKLLVYLYHEKIYTGNTYICSVETSMTPLFIIYIGVYISNFINVSDFIFLYRPRSI